MADDFIHRGSVQFWLTYPRFPRWLADRKEYDVPGFTIQDSWVRLKARKSDDGMLQLAFADACGHRVTFHVPVPGDSLPDAIYVQLDWKNGIVTLALNGTPSEWLDLMPAA